MIISNKKDISKPDYTNNILPLRERLKIRKSNLTKLIDVNNRKKINYPKEKKRKKSYSGGEEKSKNKKNSVWKKKETKILLR